MNLALLAVYSLSVLTLLLTPGPVVALITATAAQYGYRQAFMTLCGTNGASLLLLALAALMLAGWYHSLLCCCVCWVSPDRCISAIARFAVCGQEIKPPAKTLASRLMGDLSTVF